MSSSIERRVSDEDFSEVVDGEDFYIMNSGDHVDYGSEDENGEFFHAMFSPGTPPETMIKIFETLAKSYEERPSEDARKLSGRLREEVEKIRKSLGEGSAD